MRIRRLLVANRGEIAARVIRTARRLGIVTILAASEADQDGLPARLADEVVVIGPAAGAQSYLNVDAIVAAARRSRADAVHPGYGFLSENARLVRALDAAGIRFIGPAAEVLDLMGDKVQARARAAAAGLTTVPGGEPEDDEAARALAEQIGYPVLIKAVAGGGGRGMKRVDRPEELGAALSLARSEAHGAFGDARVYLERYVTSGRHIEVQILGDGARAIHLGDRDCSVQRRYQKLFEEAPATGIDPEARARMLDSAVALAEQLGYRGAGTVEFLYDNDRREAYFLEVNARVQVEHPVTEMVTGVDIVEQQLRVAEGLSLELAQASVRCDGHAIECRINAEDWTADFRPHPGRLTAVEVPVGAGIRVDTGVQSGSTVVPHYDSLVAKLIVHAADRPSCLTALAEALAAFRIEGIPTTLDLHRRLVEDRELRAGPVDTGFFPAFLERAGGGA